ncbi:MAG: DUF1501 domain-containing protein [Betaproteobacteria bacterium]|nr:DUF1501 domain-containing protein [Betaproteobacteria bacterium]MCC6247531.1 DUF1501 domain-containing protein [Rubrivivax sp.]
MNRNHDKHIIAAPALHLESASRRLFLGHGAALSALAGAGAPLALNLLAAGSAAAQAAGDYRALVCLFLFGGNDTFNMVLPTDGHNGAGAPTAGTSWAAYTTTRNQAPDPIALLAPGVAPVGTAGAGTPARLGGVLPIAPLNAAGLNTGRTFALHPLMGSLRTLFDTDRRLAIVPNVGPLVMPTTKAQYGQNSHLKPARLFSHNDQQSTWQAMLPEGATKGWGGRMGDALAAMNSNAVFTAVSATGGAVWLSGNTVQQYQVGSGGAIRVGANTNGQVYGSTAVAEALNRIVGASRGGHVFEADVAAVSQRSIAAEALLRTALVPASDARVGTPPATGNYNANADPKLQYANPLTGAMAFNAVAQQLQVVARMVEAGQRGITGARRQVFFVSLGGFDTHDAQNRNHADLMARLAHALAYFDTTLGAIGARTAVTTFTASDFGRTFTSNGDGTDHGWGAHHFVMGGAVRGGDLYGAFPALATKNTNNNNFDGSADQLGNGSLLPTTSVDQLAATLGTWFGLSGTQLADIFPNLANFDAGRRNLGFMV